MRQSERSYWSYLKSNPAMFVLVLFCLLFIISGIALRSAFALAIGIVVLGFAAGGSLIDWYKHG